MKFIKEAWNGLPPIAKAAAVIGGGFLAYKLGRPIYDNWQTKRRLKLYNQSGVNYTVVTPSGEVTQQTVNLSSRAAAIYDAIYNNDPFGATEDETRVIQNLKAVPKAFIPQLADTYRRLYNKDLQADVIAALDSDEWQQVEYLFN